MRRKPIVRKLIWLLTVAALISVLTIPLASQHVDYASRQEIQHSYRGFEFADGTCERLTEPNYVLTCQNAIGPKAWTSDEKAVLGTVIDDLMSRKDGSLLVRKAQESGASILRRYRTGFLSNATGSMAPQNNVLAVFYMDSKDKTFSFVAFPDAFALDYGLHDRRSGYNLQTEIFLHELFHSLDGPPDFKLSSAAAFRDTVGMQRRGMDWVPVGIGLDTFMTFNRQYDDLLQQPGKREEAWAFGRDFALQLPTPLPSPRVFRSLQEAFAEIGAHLVLDPMTRTSLNQRLVTYFDTCVLVETNQAKCQ